MFRAVRSTTAAMLVVAALSGCSLIAAQNQAPPTSDPTPSETTEATGQTSRQACELLLPVLVDTNTRMTEAYAVLQESGPEAMAPLLHGISDDLHAALDGVTNEEVLEVTNTFADSLDALTAQIDNILAGNGDPDALNVASKAVIDDFSAIGAVCRAA